MNIEYNGKEISIKSKEEWSYDGVSGTKILGLNADLYADIQLEVENYLDNKEKIDAENERKAEEKRIKINTEKVVEFKAMIEEKYRDLLKDFEVKFANPSNKNYNFIAKSFEFGLKGDYNTVEIEYNSKVYGQNSWRAHTTDRVWRVYFNGKNVRYADLDKAVKKGIEKLNEYEEEQERKNNAETVKNNKKDAMKKFAEDNGYEFIEEYHSRRKSNYSYSSWVTYHMKKGNVKADLTCNDDYEVSITSYTVTKENITLTELEKVQ